MTTPDVILDEETQELFDKVVPDEMKEMFSIAREKEVAHNREVAHKWSENNKERRNAIQREISRINRICCYITKDVESGSIITDIDMQRLGRMFYGKDYKELNTRQKTMVRKRLVKYRHIWNGDKI
jgi:hypothetical protein